MVDVSTISRYADNMVLMEGNEEDLQYILNRVNIESERERERENGLIINIKKTKVTVSKNNGNCNSI